MDQAWPLPNAGSGQLGCAPRRALPKTHGGGRPGALIVGPVAMRCTRTGGIGFSGVDRAGSAGGGEGSVAEPLLRRGWSGCLSRPYRICTAEATSGVCRRATRVPGTRFGRRVAQTGVISAIPRVRMSVSEAASKLLRKRRRCRRCRLVARSSR